MDQSLPTSFDNSSSVASLMPMYFAQQVGQQNNIASTNNDVLQKAFQMQQDQQSKMNPLLLLDKSAETQGRNATSAYYNSLATGKNIENTTNQAEQGPTIDAHNATSNATVKAQQYNQMANQAQKFGAVGGALKAWEDQGVPAPTQAEYAINQLGLDPNGPEAQVIRDQAGKGTLSTILSEHADHVYSQSTAAKAEAAKLASAERVEAQRASAQRDVANISAQSKQQVVAEQVQGRIAAVHQKAIDSLKDAGTALRNQADALAKQDPNNPQIQQLYARANAQDQAAQAYAATQAQANHESGLMLSKLLQDPSLAPPPPTMPNQPPPTATALPPQPGVQPPVNTEQGVPLNRTNADLAPPNPNQVPRDSGVQGNTSAGMGGVRPSIQARQQLATGITDPVQRQTALAAYDQKYGGIKSVSDLRAMYPGKSDNELRAAYKKQTGVELP